MPRADETPGGVPAPAAACLLLGAAAALLVTTLPDAVLLPAVDRWPPRHLGGALLGLCLAAGWIAGAGRRARGVGPGAPLLLGVLAAAGCFLSAWLAGRAPERVAAWLRGEGALPYYSTVGLASLLCAAPAALPLGALLGLVPGPAHPRPRAALALGAAAGFALGPPLVSLLIGPPRALQVTGLLAASAAVLLSERRPLAVQPARLTAGAACALLAAGAGALVTTRLAETLMDRGPLVGPAFAAIACLGAAAGLLLRAPASAPTWLAAAVAALPLAFPHGRFALVAPSRDALIDLAHVALPALPFGVAVGAALARREGRWPLGALPALLALPAPLVSWALLPELPARALLPLLALPAVACALTELRRHAMPLVVFAIATALGLAGAGPSPPAEAVPVDPWRRLPDGTIALAPDEAAGRAQLALDGRAPFGRSTPQDRRLAHLPLLLHPDPQTVLVVASDAGDIARAAWSHAPEILHWLRPLAAPADWDSASWPGDHVPSFGSERQFLSVPRGPYDVIVMAPDPRASRRAELVATVEFFELVRERMAPGGLLCQWWDLAITDITDLKAVLASAQQVFPEVYLMTDQPRTRRACVAVLLTDAGLSVPPARIDARLRELRTVSADFERIGIDGLGILCQITADRGMVELLAPREEALHDARPELGVRAALRPAGATRRLLVGLDTIARHRRDPMPWVAVSEAELPAVSAIVRDRFKSWQHLYAGALAVVAEQGAAGRPFDRESPRGTPEAEADALLDALAGLPDWGYLRGLVLGLSASLERDGRAPDAERLLRRAVERDPASAALRYALADVVEHQGRRDEALLLYRTVLAFEPDHSGALAAIEALSRR